MPWPQAPGDLLPLLPCQRGLYPPANPTPTYRTPGRIAWPAPRSALLSCSPVSRVGRGLLTVSQLLGDSQGEGGGAEPPGLCAHMFTHACLSVCMCTRVSVRACLCVHACVCVSVCARECIYSHVCARVRVWPLLYAGPGAGPGLRADVLGLQVPEQVPNQVHPRAHIYQSGSI